MTRRLVDLFPPGSPDLAEFDRALADSDHRRELTREPSANTNKAKASRWNAFVNWCEEFGESSDPANLDTDRICRHVEYMIAVKRYRPSTIYLGIQVLAEAARRTGRRDVDADRPRALIDAWVKKLEDLKVIKPRRKTPRRRRRTVRRGV